MFKFTIRDLLWPTVIVALAVGWFLDRQSLKQRERALVIKGIRMIIEHP